MVAFWGFMLDPERPGVLTPVWSRQLWIVRKVSLGRLTITQSLAGLFCFLLFYLWRAAKETPLLAHDAPQLHVVAAFRSLHGEEGSHYQHSRTPRLQKRQCKDGSGERFELVSISASRPITDHQPERQPPQARTASFTSDFGVQQFLATSPLLPSLPTVTVSKASWANL